VTCIIQLKNLYFKFIFYIQLLKYILGKYMYFDLSHLVEHPVFCPCYIKLDNFLIEKSWSNRIAKY